MIRHGHVKAVMLATPCSSFSTARDRTFPIRSRLKPWGLPGLPPKEAEKFDKEINLPVLLFEFFGSVWPAMLNVFWRILREAVFFC